MRSNRHPKTTSPHKQKLTTPQTETTTGGDMFDPATITWEEFLKWGHKETSPVQKDRKMRFAHGTK